MNLIEKLRAALKEAGLSEGLAEHLSVTEESQIATVIEKLKPAKPGDSDPDIAEVLGSASVAQFIEKNGFDALLKLNTKLQSEHDKKVAQGIKTFKTKLLEGEGTPPGNPPATPPANPNPAGPNDAPAWATKLFDEINALKNQKVVESKSQQAKKALEATNLPKHLKESWASRMNLDSEVSFDEQAKALAEEYKAIHTGIVANGTYEFQNENGGTSNNGKLTVSEKAELERAAKGL